MLKLFEVKGFKNFDSLVSLDFSKVHDYKFNSACISGDLIKNAIIYGRNSVGKTNIGLALFDIVAHLTTKNVSPGLYDYYLNANSDDGVAVFHYVFEFDQDIVDYRYGKDDVQSLLWEKLYVNDNLILDYDYRGGTGDLSGLSAFSPNLNWTFQGDDSILKYALNNTPENLSHPLFKMFLYISNMLWFRNLDQNRYIGYRTKTDDYLSFIFDPETLDEFSELLRQSGIEEKLIVKTDIDGKEKLYFDAEYPLPFFSVASSGTRSLYTFFYWYKTAADVSLLFIDEFDAYYHYELAESLVIFLENLPGTQTILTSHNTNLLSNRIMRPDCYFILTKESITAFADATQRELREGHNLEKLYISGEFDDK
jgi:hypothetical protein